MVRSGRGSVRWQGRGKFIMASLNNGTRWPNTAGPARTQRHGTAAPLPLTAPTTRSTKEAAGRSSRKQRVGMAHTSTSYRHIDTQVGAQTLEHTDTQTNRHADKQTDVQTSRHYKMLGRIPLVQGAPPTNETRFRFDRTPSLQPVPAPSCSSRT